MKPILEVTAEDKKLQTTLNTLFEDLYNRSPSTGASAAAAVTLATPHIDSVNTASEFNYAYIYLHCLPVANAIIYCWEIRKSGTTQWTTYFSPSNEIKITNLYFNTDYEIRVKAYGASLSTSAWSSTTITKTVVAPTPSQVTGVILTSLGTWVDPTSGVTLARVRVEWNLNADSENVDLYEVGFYED